MTQVETSELQPNGGMLTADGVENGGHDGRGGYGGQGGHGGGVGGEEGWPGEPGQPGRPGEVRSIGIPLAVLLSAIGGLYWLFKLESKAEIIAKDLAAFQSNVTNLNTPLSQRVFSLDARVGEVARIQSEVRAAIAAIDANGTSPNKLLRREVEIMRSEVAGLITRCQDTNRRLDEIQRDTVENKIRNQNLIESLMPHNPIGRK